MGNIEPSFPSRYASDEMLRLFSPEHRTVIWRKLWIALARAQKNTGIPIQPEQVSAMEKKLSDIDLKRIAYYEKQLGKEVSAHIKAFEDVCPEAKGIIHLGATGSFVTENANLRLMKEGSEILQKKLIRILRTLSEEAERHAHLPCLSYIQLRPGQPTTVGKRIALWIFDLLSDLKELTRVSESLPFFGIKGSVGTQASFLALFSGDSKKIARLESFIAEEMGFSQTVSVTGQTYSGKIDIGMMNALAGLAVSAHKFGTDIRLLSHREEIEEIKKEIPEEEKSSFDKGAPNRSERICGIARFLLSLRTNPEWNAADRWLEGTSDDTYNKKLFLPEAFFAADAILESYRFLLENKIWHPAVIAANLRQEMPFLSTEHIVTASCDKGKREISIRQALRSHMLEISRLRKEEGKNEDLVKRIAEDPSFGLTRPEIDELLSPELFTGRAAEQVREFLTLEVFPILKRKEEGKTYDWNLRI